MPGKKRYKLILSSLVQDEISDLYDYYESLYEGYGITFMENLGECLLRIEENPESWQFAKTKDERIRRGIVKKPQAIVLYRIEGDNVYIGAVKDARSNWK